LTDLEDAFPDLREGEYQITSPATPEYNCIAWAAGEHEVWWWPDPQQVAYWPPEAPRDVTVEAFVRAFEWLGYAICDDAEPEPGYEKIALFTKAGGPTHAAKQLADGSWSSKLGEAEDITHRLHDIGGVAYGAPAVYLRRLAR